MPTFDADLNATHNPSTGTSPPAAYGDKINDNFAVIGGAWTAFTPTWTTATGAAVTLGNGTLTGAYLKLEKLMIVSYSIVIGSTTTFPDSDKWRLSLPSSTTSAARAQAISGFIEDANTAQRHVIAGRVAASATLVDRIAASASTGLDSSTPFTWATSDQLILEGTIEVA